MKKFLLLAVVALSSLSSAVAQYCTPAHINSCATSYFISGLGVSGVASFAPVLPTACATTTSTAYSFGNTAPDLLVLSPGQTYTINFTNGTDAQSGSLWIDFDQNQTFDASEWIDLGRNIAGGAAVSVQFTVPASVAPGTTGMRLRTRLINNANGASDACLSFGSGLSYDFVVTFVQAQACSATPAQPVLNNTSITICPGDSSNLTYTNPPLVSGLTLLWEYSTNNGSSWQAAPGNNSGYAYKVKGLNFADGTQFRLNATCNNSPGTATSAATTLTLNPVAQCYCTTNLHTPASCVTAEGISSISIASTQFSVTPATPCTGTYVAYGTSASEVMVLPSGTTVNLDYTMAGPVVASLWIDWNKSGSFEASEWTDLGRTIAGNTAQSVQIQVPAGFTGQTKARVRTRLTGNQNAAPDACLAFGSGITYDFNVSGAAPQACSATPSVVNVAVPTLRNLCGIDSSALRYTNPPLESGLVVLWQVSPDGGVTWQPAPGNNSAFTYWVKGLNIPGDSALFRLQIGCSNGGTPTTTAGYMFKRRPIAECYCTTNLHGGVCYPTGQIPGLAFNFAFIPQMPADCSNNTDGYFRLSGTRTADTLIAGIGGTYNLDFTSPSTSTVASLWIDYDASGSFEASEWTDLGRVIAPNSGVSVPVTIPSGLTPKTTVGRLRTRASGSANGDVDGCTIFFSGVTYDFPVKLVPNVTNLNQAVGGGVMVYPNPTTGVVNVRLAQTYETVSFSITDLAGKTLTVAQPSQADGGLYTLPLNLPAGTYVLVTKAGQEMTRTKLVVK